MALKKKTQNLVISLDTKNYKLSILENFGSDYRKVNIEEYTCDTELINNKKIFEILDSVLAVYLMDKQLSNPDVYLVLPDYFITVEHIKLPILPKSKLKDALKAELRKLYFNYKELEINSTILTKNKKNITYTSTIIRKEILTDCIQALKKHNLNLRNITHTSNSIANAFLALGGRLKHTNHIICNISENHTQLIYTTKDRMLCFNNLPFGYNILNSQKLFSEYDFFTEKSSEFAVFTAREKAKNKKEITKNNKVAPEDHIPIENAFETHFAELKKQRTSLGKYIKNEKNGEILAENFETFIKHISLMQRCVVENYNLPEPEFAIVNLPEDYSSIFDFYAQNDSIKIRNFSAEIINDCSLTDYLDVYGVLYSVVYNKGNNFADKEKQSAFDKLKMNVKFAFEKIKAIFKNKKPKEKQKDKLKEKTKNKN